jgi:hypothetical protein
MLDLKELAGKVVPDSGVVLVILVAQAIGELKVSEVV